jgi:hypothetical protein
MPSQQARLEFLLSALISHVDSARNNPFFDLRTEQMVEGIRGVLYELAYAASPIQFSWQRAPGNNAQNRSCVMSITAPPIGGRNKLRIIKTYHLFSEDGDGSGRVVDTETDFEALRVKVIGVLNEWKRWVLSPDFPAQSLPVLKVDTANQLAWIGHTKYHVTLDQAEFLEAIVRAKGSPVSYMGRPDRIYGNLPGDLQDVIGKKGGAGFWVDRTKVEVA